MVSKSSINKKKKTNVKKALSVAPECLFGLWSVCCEEFTTGGTAQPAPQSASTSLFWEEISAPILLILVLLSPACLTPVWPRSLTKHTFIHSTKPHNNPLPRLLISLYLRFFFLPLIISIPFLLEHFNLRGLEEIQLMSCSQV